MILGKRSVASNYSRNNSLTNSCQVPLSIIVPFVYSSNCNSAKSMIKKKLSIVLTLALLALQSFPAYAAATPSNADIATSSNASLDYDSLYNKLFSFSSVPKATDSDAAHMVGDDIIEISADSDSIIPWAQVFDSETGAWVANVRGTLHEQHSDTYLVYKWAQLDDEYYYGQVFYQIEKADMPTPGTYGFFWNFNQADISIQYTGAKVFLRSTQNGVASEDGTVSTSYESGSMNMYFNGYCNVQIGYHTTILQALAKISPVRILDVAVPRQKAAWFTFSQNDGPVVTAPDINSGSGTTDNITSDTVIDIGNNTASIKDTLKELIVHISDQLAALWDQMYNFMHIPHLANDDKNTQTIVDTLTGGLSVEVENNNAATKEIIANQDKNTAEIKENQDKNADNIMNSYNTYKADSLSQNINNDIDEYYDQMLGAVEPVMDYLDPEFIPDSFEETDSDILLCLQLFSGYLDLFYRGIGKFSLLIEVTIVLSFVLIVIGYYRVRRM